LAAIAGALASGGLPARAQPSNEIPMAYDAAKAQYATNATNATAAWQFARACFDRADAAPTDRVRAEAAHEGIEACRRILRQEPNLAAAHYYLALNLGELAQTKKLGALSLIPEMEKEWQTARALDEKFDFAGPDRNLGLLYRDAPALLSIGSKAKAQTHLRHAVEVCPEFPDNYLFLIETDLKYKQWAQAARDYEKLSALLPAMHQKFSDPRWQSDWPNWDKREQAIVAKVRRSSSP
jgi:tetratricopeptide (TPR) repeat protein